MDLGVAIDPGIAIDPAIPIVREVFLGINESAQIAFLHITEILASHDSPQIMPLLVEDVLLALAFGTVEFILLEVVVMVNKIL